MKLHTLRYRPGPDLRTPSRSPMSSPATTGRGEEQRATRRTDPWVTVLSPPASHTTSPRHRTNMEFERGPGNRRYTALIRVCMYTHRKRLDPVKTIHLISEGPCQQATNIHASPPIDPMALRHRQYLVRSRSANGYCLFATGNELYVVHAPRSG